MSLIRATYIPAAGSNETAESRIMSDIWQVEQWAKRKLEPLYVTNDTYHRDLGRAASIRVEKGTGQEIKNNQGKFVTYIMPETHIVPSVGELGYW